MSENNATAAPASPLRFEKIVAYTLNSLIVLGIIAGVGSGFNSRLNTSAIDSLRVSVSSLEQTIKEIAATLNETALINATQTQQLVYLHDQLNECQSDLKELRRK
ncbi:MAG: hypothetical protein PVI97_19710 [Candidatus Thiodiazotropha sp.]